MFKLPAIYIVSPTESKGDDALPLPANMWSRMM